MPRTLVDVEGGTRSQVWVVRRELNSECIVARHSGHLNASVNVDGSSGMEKELAQKGGHGIVPSLRLSGLKMEAFDMVIIG